MTTPLRPAGPHWYLATVGTRPDRRGEGLAFVDEHEVTVVALDAGAILSGHVIESARRHWRNQRR